MTLSSTAVIDANASPNLAALDRITPPPTIRSQRHITRVRLTKMQAELSGTNPTEPSTMAVAA
jgi:hypothetical protein